jgi:hypothetical protein
MKLTDIGVFKMVRFHKFHRGNNSYISQPFLNAYISYYWIHFGVF